MKLKTKLYYDLKGMLLEPKLTRNDGMGEETRQGT